MLFAKLLLVVDQMKKDLKMDGWIHMPRTSDKYRLYKMLRFEYKARGYNEFGIITSFDLTKESTIFLSNAMRRLGSSIIYLASKTRPKQ